MSFESVLQAIVADCPGALGAALMGSDGIAIAQVAAPGAFVSADEVGVLGVEFGRINTPYFASVRKIEIAADRTPEASLQHGGKCFLAVLPGFEHSIAKCACGEVDWQIAGKVCRFQRKMHPPPAKSHPSVPRTIEQIIPQHRSDVRQDFGGA